MENKAQKQLIQKVRAFARAYQMFEKGGRVAVGLSGGADSVCLLLVLDELREEFGFTLSAVHVEHGIRGEESRQDAVFARELCRGKGIPLVVYEVDVPEWERRNGLGPEEAARELRYACFADFCGRLGGARLAVAHHAGDNAETLLFHLARGTGVQGLAGMRPVSQRSFRVPAGFYQSGLCHSSCKETAVAEICGRQESNLLEKRSATFTEDSAEPGQILPEMKKQAAVSFPVIRPLLCVTGEEIRDWLSARGQVYRTDSTNADLAFSRNRIRGKVLPELIEVNAQAVSHMNRTALELAGVSDFLEAEAKKAEALCVRRDPGTVSGIHIACRPFGEIAPVLQKTMLLSLIGEICGGRKDITSQHATQVLELFSRQPGKRISLPAGVLAVRTGEEVVLRKCEDKPEPSGNRIVSFSEPVSIAEDLSDGFLKGGAFFLPETVAMPAAIPLQIPGTTLCLGGIRFCTEIFDFDGVFQKIPRNPCTKWFDYDKIKSNVQVRCRLPGDYMEINGTGSRKKLNRYFIDEKIPAEKRDRVLLLADGSHILWVPGMRISEGCKITGKTQRILLCRAF